MTSTTDRLKEIRERERKATIGPWLYDESGPSPEKIAHPEGYVVARVAESGDDGRFIAHARADVPYLLDTLDAAEKERAELRAQLSAATAREAGLREALEFYADKKNWNETAEYIADEDSSDERTLGGLGHGWERARAALTSPSSGGAA